MKHAELSTTRLRAERSCLIARSDCCSFSSAIFGVVRDLEVEISWIEHRLWARRAVAPSPQTAGKQREGLIYRAG
jgi:hypothetical protein